MEELYFPQPSYEVKYIRDRSPRNPYVQIITTTDGGGLTGRIDALKISDNNNNNGPKYTPYYWGKETILPPSMINPNPLWSGKPPNEYCLATHVPDFIPYGPLKEKKKRDIVVQRSYSGHPCQVTLSLYLLSQEGVGGNRGFCDFVWCEGPCIGPTIAQRAVWFHINFTAKLISRRDFADIPGRYFAEVIQFSSSKFKVTSCVRLDDQIANVSTETSPKCVICDCNQIRHPSSKHCIADDSSMNPYDYEEWKDVWTERYCRRACNLWTDVFSV